MTYDSKTNIKHLRSYGNDQTGYVYVDIVQIEAGHCVLFTLKWKQVINIEIRFLTSGKTEFFTVKYDNSVGCTMHGSDYNQPFYMKITEDSQTIADETVNW
jgi:hypothetical protein